MKKIDLEQISDVRELQVSYTTRTAAPAEALEVIHYNEKEKDTFMS
jgi:hypothetical protein